MKELGRICLFGFTLLSLLLSGCQSQIPTDISVSNNPPDITQQSAPISSGSYITIFPREISLSKPPQGGEGKFRLLIVVADDREHSVGMFCPGTNTIPIHNGDTVSPCQAAVSFPDYFPENRLYVLIVGVNEKNESVLTDIGADALIGLLATGLKHAVGLAGSSVGPAGVVAGFALETIIGYAGEKASDWMQQREILGSQTYVLDRSQNWYSGQQIESDSQETGMRFSFTVELSNSAQGAVIASSNTGSSQQNSPAIDPTEIPLTDKPEIQRPDPADTIYAYYNALNEENYRRAWNMLTDHFIQKNNASGYGPYEEWFRTIRETQINWVNAKYQSENQAYYEVELSYYYQNGQVDTCDILRIDLVFDSKQNAWMLDDWALVDGQCKKSS